ncbi:hypothetical protein BCT10_11785 [Vibrio splendidus]|uniref:hypothetical protein n=1 Tax=Vibrio splendidus TaxID=29497 RepID=UPI000C82B6CB|nr:hypothetical protein [Vibrio splendidus]PMO45970.1 hypothetical protein BCT10_11785 [Vibrio splendidus]PTP53226.1 hypothetical protein CWN83_12435 [Vibrio splendidus]
MRYVLILLVTFLSSFVIAEPQDTDVFVPPESSVQSASICAHAYASVGNKSAARAALANSARLLYETKTVAGDDIISQEGFVELRQNIQSNFEKEGMSKRESSFYLLGSNACMLHVVMGSMYFASKSE